MSVRDLDVAVLRDTVARLLVESNYGERQIHSPFGADLRRYLRTSSPQLRSAATREESEIGRRTLSQLVRN